MISRASGTLLLACLLSVLAFGGSDPFSGVWRLNAAKSKLPPSALEECALRIDVQGNDIRIDEEGKDASGKVSKLTVLGGLDDSSYGVVGSGHFDAVSFRRTGSRRILAELRKSGTTIEWIDGEVSGNTLKLNLTEVDASGKEVKTFAILQRE